MGDYCVFKGYYVLILKIICFTVIIEIAFFSLFYGTAFIKEFTYTALVFSFIIYLCFYILMKKAFSNYEEALKLSRESHKFEVAKYENMKEKCEGLSAQVFSLKKSVKAVKWFSESARARQQVSFLRLRELVTLSHKLIEVSKNGHFTNIEYFCINNKMIMRQLEQVIKNLESGLALPVIVSPLNIYRILEETLDLFIAEGYEKHMEIKIKSDNNKIMIESDEMLLKQLFSFLLSGSFFRLPKKGKIEIYIQKEGSRVSIRIRDNGYFVYTEEFIKKTHMNYYITATFLKNLLSELKGTLRYTHKQNKYYEVNLSIPLKWH